MIDNKQYRENSIKITSLLSDIAIKGVEIERILASEGEPMGLRCRDLDLGNQIGSYVHHEPSEGIGASFIGADGRRYRVSVVPEKPKRFWQRF
jgi:hypothetical protein